MTFCKESNKLSRTENFRAWKIRTDLNLIESEVMDYVKGSHVEPSKEIFKPIPNTQREK